MILYPSVEDLVAMAESVMGSAAVVRDYGLLSASVARPQTVAFGHEPYPSIAEKAAALMVSLALNHALIDGNKRLAFTAAFAFCEVNTGQLPDMTQDEAYDMVIAVVEHRIDVKEVAEMLRLAGVPGADSKLARGETT